MRRAVCIAGLAVTVVCLAAATAQAHALLEGTLP